MLNFEEIISKLVRDNIDSIDRKKDIYRALCNVRWVNSITDEEYTCSWRYAAMLVAESEGDMDVMAYCNYYCSSGEGNVAVWIEDELSEYNWFFEEYR